MPDQDYKSLFSDDDWISLQACVPLVCRDAANGCADDRGWHEIDRFLEEWAAGIAGSDSLRRVYEVDPLICPRCASTMRVVAFITEPAQIKRILDHLRRRKPVARPPPHVPQPVASTA
jgi:hypothetical protein